MLVPVRDRLTSSLPEVRSERGIPACLPSAVLRICRAVCAKAAPYGSFTGGAGESSETGERGRGNNQLGSRTSMVQRTASMMWSLPFE